MSTGEILREGFFVLFEHLSTSTGGYGAHIKGVLLAAAGDNHLSILQHFVGIVHNGYCENIGNYFVAAVFNENSGVAADLFHGNKPVHKGFILNFRRLHRLNNNISAVQNVLRLLFGADSVRNSPCRKPDYRRAEHHQRDIERLWRTLCFFVRHSEILLHYKRCIREKCPAPTGQGTILGVRS